MNERKPSTGEQEKWEKSQSYLDTFFSGSFHSSFDLFLVHAKGKCYGFDGAEEIARKLHWTMAVLNCSSNGNPNNQLCCQFNIFNLPTSKMCYTRLGWAAAAAAVMATLAGKTMRGDIDTKPILIPMESDRANVLPAFEFHVPNTASQQTKRIRIVLQWTTLFIEGRLIWLKYTAHFLTFYSIIIIRLHAFHQWIRGVVARWTKDGFAWCSIHFYFAPVFCFSSSLSPFHPVQLHIPDSCSTVLVPFLCFFVLILSFFFCIKC